MQPRHRDLHEKNNVKPRSMTVLVPRSYNPPPRHSNIKRACVNQASPTNVTVLSTINGFHDTLF